MDPIAALQSAGLVVEADTRRGILRGLADASDPVGPGYLAAEPALARWPAHGARPPREHRLWTGDVVCQVWDDGGWRHECTACSADTRTVDASGAAAGALRVAYAGGSTRPGGMRLLALTVEYRLNAAILDWSITLRNRSSRPLELGELAIPLVANTDVASIFEGLPPGQRTGGEAQRRWHEERVQQYLHIAGHGSYVLLQRPSGQGRIASLVPAGDTALEAAYQLDPDQGSQWSDVFEGPYFLAPHSRAARDTRGWLARTQRQNRWFHGATSRLLAPGEMLRFGFEVALLDDAAGLPGRLTGAGQVAVQAAPGYAVGAGRSIRLAIAGDPAPRLTPEADSVSIAAEALAADGIRRYTLRFGTPGQKPVRIDYGAGRWTRVLCYVTPRPAAALRARARFIAARQLYRNRSDPFGRHAAFLPYDDQVQQIYTDSEEAWQVGGSDEYGLPVAMFLAANNVRMPVRAQVRALETYIDGFLLGRLQDPETLDIRRGMFHAPAWSSPGPSSPGPSSPEPSRRPHEWTREESRDPRRFNNYPLVASIYHAMYQVAREHGLTRSRPAAGYLRLAWRTAVRGFEIGALSDAGAPAGAGLFSLLEDLEAADPEGFAALEARLRAYAALVARDRYPYGSELYIDQTAHSQAYAALQRFGPPARREDCLRVTRTLRWGFQPSWFRYGGDQRGSVCCWYGTTQNSEVLLKGFEATGDQRLLSLGAAGLSSFLACVRPDGAARGWFTWWPDRTGFDPRSLDTDLGLFGYLRSAAAYVVTTATFGRVGYGCAVAQAPGGTIEVTPDNGVDDRISFCDHGLAVRSDGRIRRAVLSADATLLRLELDRTSLAREDVNVWVGGPGAPVIALAENATGARVAGSAAAGSEEPAGAGLAGAGSAGAGSAGAESAVTLVGVTRGRPAEVVIRLAR